MSSEQTPSASSKILMREEVLADGTPLPLAEVMAHVSISATQSADVHHVWSETMAAMKEEVEGNVPSVTVVMPPLWQGEAAKAGKLKDLEGFPVSLDSYDTTGSFPLRVSRHFAVGGKEQIGIGRRPGAPDLDMQVGALVKAAGGEPVVLLEDDMFTGGTARHIVRLLQSEGLEVLKFIPGLQVSDAAEVEGVAIEPIERFAPGEVADIIDPRDFLFGLREAGLVIKQDRRLYRAPYIMPWVDLTERGGIPRDRARKLSRGLSLLNAQFYSSLGEIADRSIMISDLSPAFQGFIAASTDYPPAGDIVGFSKHAASLSKS